MPLKPGARPGRSQFSHGKGRVTEPRSDYQSQRALVFPQGDDKRDAVNRMQAEKRLDATNPLEVTDDMYYELGNPDAFGPGPQLVQERVEAPPAVYKQPIWRYGVDRES